MTSARRSWTEEEDQALGQAVERLGFKSWALIATNLTKIFGVPRRGKQCRQRWHNHLNPDIDRKSWTKKEEERLFELHKIHGNKWTVITDSLPGRTDNAIKNYFYSTIRRSLRRIGKFLGSKNSTHQMKDIKPSTLSKIFAADHQLFIDDFQAPEQQELIRFIREHSQMVRSYIIKFTNYKPKRNEKAALAEKKQLEDVIRKMIFINDTYERLKQDDRLKKKDEEGGQRDHSRNMETESNDESESERDSQEEKEVKEEAQSEEKYGRTAELKTQIIKETNYLTKKTFELKLESFNEPFQNEYQQRKVPTASIKPQPNGHDKDLNSVFDLPDFQVDLKDQGEGVPSYMQKQNIGLQSPGFFFTPNHNPFTYFYSPSTPHSVESSLSSSFGVLHHSTLDEFQMMIQRQIQSNLNGDPKLSGTSSNSSTTIGASPGSAFRYL